MRTAFDADLFLLNLCLFAQFFLIVRQSLLAHHLFQLRLHLLERWNFDRTCVDDFDHVPAEFGLHGLDGQLSFWCGGDGFRKRFNVIRCGGPTQVAAFFGAAGIFRVFLG